jgi:hypothetical protein
VSVERWKEELKMVGFGDVEFTIYGEHAMAVALIMKAPRTAI